MTVTIPEIILEPDLPIIDPHHHLWDFRPMLPALSEPHHPFIAGIAGAAHYTFEALHTDTRLHPDGHHNIVGTVYMECGAFYRASESDALKPVGEIEFVNGVAAQSASGLYGDFRACAGIVGHADLTLGDGVVPVLEVLSQAAGGNEGGRFRGIRHQGAWDADLEVLGPACHADQGLYRSDAFQQGFRHLGDCGNTFDAWVLEPQLGDVIALARAFPDQPICLDHCGTPLNIASYKGTLDENFERWRLSIQELAKCENVSVKLGGLAMPFCGMPEDGPAAGYDSETLAKMWRPYIDTCIEAFGQNRAMFESNYPVDRWGASYPVLWNAFKRIVSGASDDEKRDLFAGTAARFYGLEGLAI